MTHTHLSLSLSHSLSLFLFPHTSRSFTHTHTHAWGSKHKAEVDRDAGFQKPRSAMAQGSDSNDTSYKSPSPGSRPVSPLPPSRQRAPACVLAAPSQQRSFNFRLLFLMEKSSSSSSSRRRLCRPQAGSGGQNLPLPARPRLHTWAAGMTRSECRLWQMQNVSLVQKKKEKKSGDIF